MFCLPESVEVLKTSFAWRKDAGRTSLFPVRGGPGLGAPGILALPLSACARRRRHHQPVLLGRRRCHPRVCGEQSVLPQENAPIRGHPHGCGDRVKQTSTSSHSYCPLGMLPVLPYKASHPVPWRRPAHADGTTTAEQLSSWRRLPRDSRIAALRQLAEPDLSRENSWATGKLWSRPWCLLVSIKE